MAACRSITTLPSRCSRLLSPASGRWKVSRPALTLLKCYHVIAFSTISKQHSGGLAWSGKRGGMGEIRERRGKSQEGRVKMAASLSSTSGNEVQTSDAQIQHRVDPYGGIIIDSEALPSNVNQFSKMLTQSVGVWTSAGVGGIWLKVPLARAHLVGAAVDCGFVFHHAEPEYVMLTTWLEDSKSRLPCSASTHLGVGAFVLNSKKEVLMVMERKGPAAGQGLWKMPTGHVDMGEEVSEAAMREVWEETGVKTEFKSVLGIRHAHDRFFGKGDMFFVCALQPVGSQEINICTEEIAEAKWVPLEQFLNNPMLAPESYVKYFNELCASYAKGSYNGIQMIERDIGVREVRNINTSLYTGTFEEELD